MSEDLKFFSSLESAAPFYIVLAGVTYSDPAYHIRRTNSDVAVIEYITDGEGYVTCAGKKYSVCKDMIYFLSQGDMHNYYSNRENPFTKIFLNVSGSFCEHLVAAYGLSDKHFFNGLGLKPIFEKIPAAIHSDMAENEMQAFLQGIFVEILSRLSLAQAETIYSDEAIKLKSYIDSNLDRIIPMKELAKVIYHSSDYCLKLFSHEFKITPYAYQLERKMHIAKFLLADTNMSVGKIAEFLGYCDPHYFSNLFQKKCGCRPLNYRKSRR